MTDRCKNITLPQTSFEEGTYCYDQCARITSIQETVELKNITSDDLRQISILTILNQNSTQFINKNRKTYEQECIPVGCVPAER